MEIIFNQDGSIKKSVIDQFIQQFDNATKISFSVDGLEPSEYIPNAYGIQPNGKITPITFNATDNGYELALSSTNTYYAGQLLITITITLNLNNYRFTYPFALTINSIGITSNAELVITIAQYNTFLSELHSLYYGKTASDSRYQIKYAAENVRAYEDAPDDLDNLVSGQVYLTYEDGVITFNVKDGDSLKVDEAKKATYDGNDDEISSTYVKKLTDTGLQKAYVKDTNGNTIGVKLTDLNAGNSIPMRDTYGNFQVSTPINNNDATNKGYVDNAVGTMTARYITSSSTGNNFSTRSALVNATQYYYGNSATTPNQNDYAFVESDEAHENKSSRYVFQNNTWVYQYSITTGGGTTIEYITISVPASATSGTITEDDLDTLQRANENYIVFVGDHEEIYRLVVDATDEGFLVYGMVEYESNETAIKTITITINTLAWVLNKTVVNDIDVSNLAKTNQSNTFTAEQTFSGGVKTTYLRNASGTVNVSLGSSDSVFWKNVRPSGNKTLDNGASSYVWDTTYTDKLNDGTNSIAVANIEKKQTNTTLDTATYSGSLGSNINYRVSVDMTSLNIVALEQTTGYNTHTWKIKFVVGTDFAFSSTPTLVWKYGTPNWANLEGEEVEILIEKSLTANVYNAWVI